MTAFLPSSASPHAWMRLPSGRRIDLADPDPQAWTDRDLSQRLARVSRWGGESIWPLPLSVAQHSLAVLALRSVWAKRPLGVGEQLRELLHDAEDAFLGFDCIGTLKPLLGERFREVGERLSRAVAARYALPSWTGDDWAEHKRIDVACAASEALHCVGWTRDEIANVLGIREPILMHDPLAEVYGDRPWEPWPGDVAAERFHDVLLRLVVKREREVLEKQA
jgi:hypothetical protein